MARGAAGPCASRIAACLSAQVASRTPTAGEGASLAGVLSEVPVQRYAQARCQQVRGGNLRLLFPSTGQVAVDSGFTK